MVEVNTAASDEWDTSNEAPDGDEYEDEYEPDEDTDEYDDEADAPPTKEPKFANVIEWVNGYFLPVIRRRISDNDGGRSWDPRWWAYPEVVARLTALYQAWEEARVSDSMAAMSSWWIQHLEPHLRVILDGDTGPMANAKSDRSFLGWPAMPSDPVPAPVLSRILSQEQ
ncbi:DUF4913 domain-containing protein (plasmid) [Rhodococcus pyridinivorans]|uniref:DUF4913 domain-containing protein n=1 Tax=Rhodococcus TaxID=1827 RepID=UPI000E6AE645|nr:MULTISPECIES: DUF4913 domain-containing protein [Rhodococcus]AXY49341.1 hypothetical protein YT1_p10140 [Rhodococcus ruber]MCT7293949.1 DUF4913 domain-containing protein [Rhodococcus sp. PAE-6]UVT27795.1 DUF4913 domain-containing protein [Rhodococcus pyridinivorans]